jgi:hypothetical protein
VSEEGTDHSDRARKAWASRRGDEASAVGGRSLAAAAREVLERLAASSSGSVTRTEALAGLGVPEGQFDWAGVGRVDVHGIHRGGVQVIPQPVPGCCSTR